MFAGRDRRNSSSVASLNNKKMQHSSSAKRKSSGFLKTFMTESRDVLMAPFNTSKRKSSTSSDNGISKDKGTQTKITDLYNFNGLLGSSSSAFFVNRYPNYARRRKNSRARSVPSTKSLTNLVRENGTCSVATSTPQHQSYTLPARLEHHLLSPEWHRPMSLRHSPSSALSTHSVPVMSPRNGFTSTRSSCRSEDSSTDNLALVWRSLVDPVVRELMKYPWGRDSLWLIAFVFIASSLVLLSYVITTVIPTLILAVSLAVLKSLVFNHTETMKHLRALADAARCSVFTHEFIDSITGSTLELINKMLQLFVPPAISKN